MSCETRYTNLSFYQWENDGKIIRQIRTRCDMCKRMISINYDDNANKLFTEIDRLLNNTIACEGCVEKIEQMGYKK